MANIFETFNNCLKKRPFNNQDFDSFMFCRWLGSSPKTIHIANLINFYYKLDHKLQYELVQSLTNEKFIRYISAKYNKTDTSDLERKYKISSEKAQEYKEILDLYSNP